MPRYKKIDTLLFCRSLLRAGFPQVKPSFLAGNSELDKIHPGIQELESADKLLKLFPIGLRHRFIPIVVGRRIRYPARIGLLAGMVPCDRAIAQGDRNKWLEKLSRGIPMLLHIGEGNPVRVGPPRISADVYVLRRETAEVLYSEIGAQVAD